MNRLQPVAAILGAVLLAGCFGGLKSEAPAPLAYRINAPHLPPGAPVAADLLVAVEATSPGLDGAGIAARFPGGRIDYLAGARWPVKAPALVESALLEALQDSGRLRSVQGDFSRFRATHSLALELRQFEADYTAGELPVARVALAATVGRLSDRRVLATFAVAAEERAAENRVSAVVAALDAAFARAAGEVSGRGLDAIAADLVREPQSGEAH
jgi:cholesterol transport system auxiliary component